MVQRLSSTAAALLTALSLRTSLAVATPAVNYDHEEQSLGGQQADLVIADDECTASGKADDDHPTEACAFHALQRRSRGDTRLSYSEVPPGEPLVITDGLPDGWNASDYARQDLVEDGELGAAAAWATHHSVYCPSNPWDPACALYVRCQGPPWCDIAGYMVVPGFYSPGMESINSGTARKFNYLMDAAHSRCADEHCVLITNPECCRTQEELHIHYRHYTEGGAVLKRQLEHTLCHSRGWKHFSKCGSGKARIYSHFPDVFSEVAEAYGGGSLKHVGITVWTTAACGGMKTMLLATTHCSIEHSISDR